MISNVHTIQNILQMNNTDFVAYKNVPSYNYLVLGTTND